MKPATDNNGVQRTKCARNNHDHNEVSLAAAGDVALHRGAYRHSSVNYDKMIGEEEEEEPRVKCRHAEPTAAVNITTRESLVGTAGAGTSRLPLPEVISRTAFECEVDAHGVISKLSLLDDIGDHSSITLNRGKHGDDRRHIGREKDMADGKSRRAKERPRRATHQYAHRPLLANIHYALEPWQQDLLQGSASQKLWGVDLHLCDLSSFVGAPEEGESPWHSGDGREKEDEPDEIQWQCLFLDASVNRLRGVDVVAEQAGFAHVAVLDVSYNLLDNLDRVQELSNLQVLLASNNQLESADALGICKTRSRLRHVDLSNNSIHALKAPRYRSAFCNIRTLQLSRNRLVSLEPRAAEALTSLEWLDIADNELVDIDAVALLPTLLFLDCSGNRISDLATLVKALMGLTGLAEVVAEGNEVVSAPEYRLTVLMNCRSVRRLDHRPVDATALKRRFHRFLEAKSLADVRETAYREYYRSVEEGRARLEQRKAVIKSQEKQLNDAFEAYRVHRHVEVGECVAYAESLRREHEQGNVRTQGLLTPDVARAFQDELERRYSEEGGFNPGVRRESNRGNEDDNESLADVLRGVVAKEERFTTTAITTSTPSISTERKNRTESAACSLASVYSLSSQYHKHRNTQTETTRGSRRSTPSSSLGSNINHSSNDKIINSKNDHDDHNNRTSSRGDDDNENNDYADERSDLYHSDQSHRKKYDHENDQSLYRYNSKEEKEEDDDQDDVVDGKSVRDNDDYGDDEIGPRYEKHDRCGEHDRCGDKTGGGESREGEGEGELKVAAEHEGRPRRRTKPALLLGKMHTQMDEEHVAAQPVSASAVAAAGKHGGSSVESNVGDSKLEKTTSHQGVVTGFLGVFGIGKRRRG